MSKLGLFKRRHFLLLGGAGAAGFLGGGAVTAGVINMHGASPVQSAISSSTSLLQSQAQDDGPYLSPGTFNQQFLAKSADIKQVWDFAGIDQIQSDSFTPIKNALNAFQFTYHKSLYPVICLRGSAVIYALDDAMWSKYGLGTVYGQQNGETTDQNPLYHRYTTDNGTLSPQDPDSLYQDPSLQALNGLSILLATKRGLLEDSTFKELATHLVPGTQQTPSGSSLIAVAQHLGFTYAKQ